MGRIPEKAIAGLALVAGLSLLSGCKPNVQLVEIASHLGPATLQAPSYSFAIRGTGFTPGGAVEFWVQNAPGAGKVTLGHTTAGKSGEAGVVYWYRRWRTPPSECNIVGTLGVNLVNQQKGPNGTWPLVVYARDVASNTPAAVTVYMPDCDWTPY